MKHVLTMLMVFFLISLTACSNPDQHPMINNEQENSQMENIPNSNSSTNKTLVIYFSRWGNTNYPEDIDASTSASIVIEDENYYGTTEYAAREIADEVGGDLYQIETDTPYTADFDELRSVNHDEKNQNFYPQLKETTLDISTYDTVFIGYPVWASSVPQAILSFLNMYDLSEKTVIPFCTHDGYGAGSSYQTIAEASHAALSLDGLAIEAKDVLTAKDKIRNWLMDIGISGSKETTIQIIIGEIILEGVLYDTALADEIKAYFPLTISMGEFGGREYYGGVDFYPENLEGGQKYFEDGEITYCEAHHNIAIFYSQSNDPNLSVDVIPIGKVTSDLSIFNDLDSREEITFSLIQ